MIAVVVTTYLGASAVVDACLRSVIAAGGADHVLLVDNGGAAAVPDDLAAEVELLRAPSNRGFGAAANLGFARARELGATRIALLNDDVVVEHGWLQPLDATLVTDRRIGAVQAKLLLAGTDPPRINSLGVTVGRDGAGVDIGYGELDGPEYTGTRTIDAFTGNGVLFDAAMLAELGGFDERYFLYYEDVDLAGRGRERGWEYRCAPASRVWHRVGASTGKTPLRTAWLRERNRLWTLLRFAGAGDIARGAWLSIRRLRHAPRRAHGRGLVTGLAAAPRLLRERRRAG